MILGRIKMIIGAFAASLWLFLPTVAEESSGSLHIEAEIPHRGDYMCVGFGSLWMMSEQTLLRVALTDNAITEIPIEGATGRWRRTIVGEGAVWVADNLSQIIYKIDPSTNQVALTIKTDIPVENEAAAEIAVGGGSVWAVEGSKLEPTLRRYSAQTGMDVAGIPLPSPSTDRGIVYGFNSVWVAGAREGELYRIDTVTNQILATIELEKRPLALASGEGSIWVREVGGMVQRIDGDSGKLLATFPTDAADKYGEIVVGGGFVWMNGEIAPLVQIDPRTNTQRSRFNAPTGTFMGYSISYGGGSVWLGGGAIFRIKAPE